MMSAIEVGEINPPPTACAMRNAMMLGGSQANAVQIEAAVKSASPKR
jgi:hypothetical protein